MKGRLDITDSNCVLCTTILKNICSIVYIFILKKKSVSLLALETLNYTKHL